MAFADPQSLTVDSESITLPRTGSTGNTGAFTSADQKYKLAITHNGGNRRTHVARVEYSDIVANPLVPATNSAIGAAVTFTVNTPINGLSAEDAVELASALVAWLTPQNVAKLVGGEQ